MVNVSKSKPKGNSFFMSVRNYFREYCSCTSIHGFRYFGEKRTIFERVWWSLVFAICLTACVTLIYGVYRKWEGSPVIVNFANQGTPIHKIPFPAVTVCPEAKASQNAFNYTNVFQKKISNLPITTLESQQFEYMSLICDYQPKKVNYMKNLTFPNDFFDVLSKIQVPFMIRDCTYLGSPIDCKSIFIPIVTDEGLCYTFNMLDRSEIFRDNVVQYQNYHSSWYRCKNWSAASGYSEDAGTTAYPRRALLAGATNGLTFKLVTFKSDLDYACTNSIQGYKALLHLPINIPRPSEEYFRIPLDQIVIQAIEPVMISTSGKVQMYNPKRRACYFPSERHLKYFKIYSPLNCKMECLTNYTIKRCHCVNFYMPRENGTKICGTGKIECLRETERFMQMQDSTLKLVKSQLESDCNCLPICTDVNYSLETSQSNWDWSKGMFALEEKSLTNSHLSSVTIYFKSEHFITCERNELYGPIDFLANFGGLLGLFTGFSVLSLMEILYFLTIRILCNIGLYGYWAGAKTEDGVFK